MASKNKYVIRVQRAGVRSRFRFPSKRAAEAFAKAEGLPKSQIKGRCNMDDEDFIAAMSEGIPPIAPPDPPSEAGEKD